MLVEGKCQAGSSDPAWHPPPPSIYFRCPDWEQRVAPVPLFRSGSGAPPPAHCRPLPAPASSPQSVSDSTAHEKIEKNLAVA
jgi:hypothetical protein